MNVIHNYEEFGKCHFLNFAEQIRVLPMSLQESIPEYVTAPRSCCKARSCQRNHQKTAKYLWQVAGLDVPLMRNEEYFVADGNKNILALKDASGNTTVSYNYDPFGKVTASNIHANPFQFSSEYHDPESGLVYYNYRYYSPILGRWLNHDPIEEQGGYNLYAMVSNNVICHVDMLGLVISIKSCFVSPAEFMVCVDLGIISFGKVSAPYVNKGGDLVKLLVKWGGKVVKGGKGSHTKVCMPNGKTVTVPQSPGKGTVESILKDATAK